MIDQRCAEMGLPCVSVLEPVLTVFQSYLGTPAGRRVGAQHVLDAEYFRRIDALNFTMEHDDGQLPDDIDEADIVLIGISRTSKTPTSIYLANRGIKTANIPIVLGVPIPDSLIEAKRPLIVGLVATAERVSQVRQNRVLGTRDELRFADLCRPRDDRRGTELCPPDLHAPRLADDRRDAALDRRDGGRDRCAARQGALVRRGHQAERQAMPENIILASSSPFRKALLANAGIAFAAVKPDIDERAAEAPLKDSGATPEDVALVLAERQGGRGQRAQSAGAGHRLRPDAVARRRDLPQAGRHGSGAPPSARAVGQDASAEQRRRAGPRRRNAVVACRHRQADDAQARAGLHRPLSGARRRQGAVERRRLSDRGRGHPAVREDRRRLFHHRRPAACCRCLPHFGNCGAIDG